MELAAFLVIFECLLIGYNISILVSAYEVTDTYSSKASYCRVMGMATPVMFATLRIPYFLLASGNLADIPWHEISLSGWLQHFATTILSLVMLFFILKKVKIHKPSH